MTTTPAPLAHTVIEHVARDHGWPVVSQENLPGGHPYRQTFGKDGVFLTVWYSGRGTVTVASVAHPGDNKATKFERRDLKARVVNYMTNV